jgi:hypothetical protein
VEGPSFIRRVIAATLVTSPQETQPTSRAPRFQLSESAKENLVLILALVIPIVIMGLLMWVLSRGAKAGRGFAEWASGGTAS